MRDEDDDLLRAPRPAAAGRVRAHRVMYTCEHCGWEAPEVEAGEQTERMVIYHFSVCHPALLETVKAMALKGELVKP